MNSRLAFLSKRLDGFGMKAYKKNWMLYALLILIVVGVVMILKR